MLQRIQTLWLLLATTCGILTLKFSFFSGNKIDKNQVKTFQYLTATESILILIITVIVFMAALIAIFLYKNRKLQLRICIAGIIVSLVNIFLYYKETKTFAEGNYDLTAILSIAIPVFFILATRGINKDEKLVKSLDRLR
jgi:drug/metabolite transporter (DMT)-like permease